MRTPSPRCSESRVHPGAARRGGFEVCGARRRTRPGSRELVPRAVFEREFAALLEEALIDGFAQRLLRSVRVVVTAMTPLRVARWAASEPGESRTPVHGDLMPGLCGAAPLRERICR